MTRTQFSAIALALSAMLAAPAMATDNGPATRAQVKAELAEAVRAGNIMVTEGGQRLNEIYPNNYPEQQHLALKTRKQA